MAYFSPTTVDTDTNITTQIYYVKSGVLAFIPSGSEYAFGNLYVQGTLRVDGKVVAGEIEVTGTLKVVGSIEIEPLFS